jgi:YfiH family protein
MLVDGALAGVSHVRHGFFTRQGGVSQGMYASLNCGLGSGDLPHRVEENRARVAARLGYRATDLVTCYQVHSPCVLPVERSLADGERPTGDGMVTRMPGVVLGILTADCAPVLLADRQRPIVGAVHAGWRGAKEGVLGAAVQAMVELGADRGDLVAAIGPCIRQSSYEIGPDFYAAFVADDPHSAALFRPSERPQHFLFDLAEYARLRLAVAGVGTISVVPHDTFVEEERFFSFRRMTVRGGSEYGRQLSVIALAP